MAEPSPGSKSPDGLRPGFTLHSSSHAGRLRSICSAPGLTEHFTCIKSTPGPCQVRDPGPCPTPRLRRGPLHPALDQAEQVPHREGARVSLRWPARPRCSMGALVPPCPHRAVPRRAGILCSSTPVPGSVPNTRVIKWEGVERKYKIVQSPPLPTCTSITLSPCQQAPIIGCGNTPAERWHFPASAPAG